MDDHYFETRFSDFDGSEVPPKRYRTLRWAKARAEKLCLYGSGSIWYQGETSEAPLEMVRYTDDGTIIDVTNGDGTTYEDDTTYPLEALPSFIEPGQLAFALWLHAPDGTLELCEFWFEWDSDTDRAKWSCGGSSAIGGDSFTWTDDEVIYDENEKRNVSFEPIYRDSWVNAARDLYYGVPKPEIELKRGGNSAAVPHAAATAALGGEPCGYRIPTG